MGHWPFAYCFVLFSFFPINTFAAQPVRLTMMDARMAVPRLSVWNEGIKRSTNNTIAPFKTNTNNPRVSSVKGNVKMKTTGRTMAFTMPSSNAAIQSDAVESNDTPLRI